MLPFQDKLFYPCALCVQSDHVAFPASVSLVGPAAGGSQCSSENPSFTSTRMDRLPQPLQIHSCHFGLCHHLFPPILCSLGFSFRPHTPASSVFSASPVVFPIYSMCWLHFIAGLCLPKHNSVMLFLPHLISDGIQTRQEGRHVPAP